MYLHNFTVSRQTLPVKQEALADDLQLKKTRRRSNQDEVSAAAPATGSAPAPATAPSEVPFPQPVEMPLDSTLVAEENKVFIGDVEVVIENGKFICPVKICGKHFRRENLLHVRDRK